MRNFLRKNLVYIFIAIIFAIFATVITALNISSEIEYYAEDAVYQKADKIPNNIKIIGVDETTIEQYGPYSEWGRDLIAELVEFLSDSKNKPTVIGIDFSFAGSKNSNHDQRFVEAVKNHGNVVIASKVTFSNGSRDKVSKEVTSFDALNEVSYSGFTTPLYDKDGYIRRSYGKIINDNKEYTSFALQVANHYGYKGEDYKKYEFMYSGTPGDFEMIPMSKVLDGSISNSYFKDCIVLIGAYEDEMMDSYKTSISHTQNMFEVEIQANAINALLTGKIITPVPIIIQCIYAFVIILFLGFVIINKRISVGIISTILAAIIYPLLCMFIFNRTQMKMNITYIPIIALTQFITMFIVRYLKNQRQRAKDMQQMLFSMADSMAEAIEGLTPYNANHTHNVARRSVEMLEYINKLNKEKKTKLRFTENDINQMYLAAMLHDIGKMDIPTEVMDKSTRLGNKIYDLKNRFEIIKLHYENDLLNNKISKSKYDKEITDMEKFLEQLDSFNTGRPLNLSERIFIDDIAKRKYILADGNEIPYITEPELDAFHIKAGTLSDKERKIMQSHVVYTDKILSHVQFGREFDKVLQIASDHHELLNGMGYPNHKKGEELHVMTRILTIMDIYDSLISDDRPYKKPKSNRAAFSILDDEADNGRIDRELLDIAKQLYLLGKNN